jgi:NAD(P)H-flavin reductase
MSGPIPIAALITATKQLSDDTTLYTLLCTSASGAIGSRPSVETFLPGQFLDISLPGVGETPISYCGIPSPDGTIELCIRHIGHVTLPLRNAVAGNAVGLRGPFGHGFPLEVYRDQDLLLIAGGIGMAPLRSLLLALLKQREWYRKITVLYGARQRGKLLFSDELLELQKRGNVILLLAVDSHDDAGELPPGCRVALLPSLLDGLIIDPHRTYTALCGPPVVYPSLLNCLKRLGLADDRIHISLERRMKCGVGQCGHCAVGTYLCCIDGPVFSYARLRGIEGALT